ncbi:hypothetical protein COD94_05045 [Bacillus cereus]|nr:hypothetical protein COD94_05045 [Bacillus cereus]
MNFTKQQIKIPISSIGYSKLLAYSLESLYDTPMTSNKEEEIDKVLPWSMDLPSSCRVPKKSEVNKK